MNTVEPIRDIEKLQKMKKLIKKEKGIKEWLVVVFGLNTGLRISDILSLRWGDILNGKVRDKVYIREKKTSKEKTFILNDSVKDGVEEYLNCLKKEGYQIIPDNYVFFSDRRVNNPLTRQYIHKIINEYGKRVGLDEEKLGTHSLRKTMGWYLRTNKNVGIEVLMKLFNHSSTRITERYIGLEQKEIDDVYSKVDI